MNLAAILRRVWPRDVVSADAPAPGLDLPGPFPPIYAVGDIHGEVALYRQLERRILADRATRFGDRPALVVILGDMIDRGPDSAGLIDFLLAPAPRGLRRLCLMGNHEQMALAFLTAPDPRAAWLDHGGAQTLASYGIVPDPRHGYRMPARRLRALVAAHVPPAHLAFLRGLPAWLWAGHFFCHAGTAPDRSLTRQSLGTLLWSRGFDDPSLPAPADLGGALVVHGHMPQPRAVQRGWRINVDSGACATGRLSAVRLVAGDEPAFLIAEHGPAPVPACCCA
ncbi:metallophosphoesterase [Pontitalea aquivivens]|uniref:metallophosphoesterase n=1 Tax=Pontitalea aquivivens TaxID=3388663 RepID=UPI003970A007